ncbi:hypothetical protein HCU01_01220 [Halomonas cupida]|uniref:Uncharacterized protein n=1 Tax=Halomonas cupida TaxID=44933 RepID=A0A1M7B1S9_9GAMM|nr:hypothetical protein [Halomonas cupida]GEN22173.1 hypothetical protein HCU01_01220 [Halomonas cupida]SHL48940.1 hypothetical protein SAMN05660971_00727 [Halomonas cupida]
MPTKRSRQSGVTPLDDRLIGLFSVGTNCHQIPNKVFHRKWLKYGERYLAQYDDGTRISWGEMFWGRPWLDIPPVGFRPAQLHDYGEAVFVGAFGREPLARCQAVLDQRARVLNQD